MIMAKEIWYRADFEYLPKDENDGDGTDEYLCQTLDETTTMEELDKRALKWAKEVEKEGEDFDDVGHVKLQLVLLVEVDGEKECFPETRTVWY